MYPEENRVCFRNFIVQLFKIPKKECTNCEEIIYNNEVTENYIYITLNDTLCTNYLIVVWSSNGVNSTNRKFGKLDFSNQKDDDKQLNWHDTKFSLVQESVYFIADIYWTLPQNLIFSICFPHFIIQLCNGIKCKSFPNYLGNHHARITDLMPNTWYTVKFNIIRNKTPEQIGSLLMYTEEIPRVQNLFGEIKGPETIKLYWNVPNKIVGLKEWFTLVLQEENGEYATQEIDSDKSNIVLENLKPCHDYKFSMEVEYNGYRSKANTVHLSTPVPQDETHPVKGFRMSNVSSTSVELSWNVGSNFCNFDFQIQYTDSGIIHSYTANSSKLEIRNLTSCTKYTFYIYSIDKKAVRKQEDLVQIVTMFDYNQPVVNLTTQFKSPYGFYITWEPPQIQHCLSKYLIYLYHDSNLTLHKYERLIYERSVNFTNLTPCSTYKVKVISMWHVDEGNSTEIYVDTLSLVPEKVRSLAAFDAGDEIQLTWQHPGKLQNCVNKYVVQVEETFTQKNIVSKIEIPRTQNRFIFSNLLNACTNYTFYIRSVTSDNKYSEFVSTFFELRPDELYITDGQVVAVTAYSVKIKWEVKGGVCPVTNFASFCKLQEKSMTYRKYTNEFSPRSFVQNFDNLKPEKSYICWAEAYNQHGDVSYSKATTAQTSTLILSEPTNFTVLNKTTDSVYIVWSPPQEVPEPITEYFIKTEHANLDYYIPSGCTETYIADRNYSVPGNVTGFLINGLQPYTNFDVSVNAVIGNKFGTSSPTLTATTLPDVPEQVRNLRVHLLLNETIITWWTPCKTHGVLSHFLGSMSATRLNNLKYPALPQRNWTIAVGKNKINYTQVFKDLLPEYDYEMVITAVVINVTQENPKIERFQCPAGIPPESLMTSDVTLTILSSTKVAVSFNYNLFNDSQGEIRYYALLFSVSNFSQPEQSGWLGTNNSWPQENTWAEARLNSQVFSYQVTPLYWNPFTEMLETHYILGEEDCDLQLNSSFCNGPLLENTQYSLRIRGFTSSGYRDTVSMTFSTETKVSSFQVVLVSVGFAGIIITVLIVFLVVSGISAKELLSKKSQKKITVVPHVGPPPMSPKKFLVHCSTVLDDEGRMKEEFDLLIGQSSKLASPTKIAVLPHNTKKNRYANILPYDSNRVILEGDAESDYINASYIKFPGEKFIPDYIACQAPKKDYCKDFWKMICQCNINLIIMLCQFIEENNNKCSEYFPEKGEVLTFDDISIFCKVQTKFSHYILRVLVINQNGLQRTVNHCHCVDWPDFGIPSSSTEVMLDFCHYINRLNKTKQHTLVHCSAGVGRTGTYIAIAVLLEQLNHNKELSVFATIMQMRSQRANMVQTRGQYEYIYKCLKFAIENQKTKIKKFYQSAVGRISDLKEEKTISSDHIGLTENPVPSVHSSTNQVML